MNTFKIALHSVSFIEKPDKEQDFDWELFNCAFDNREVDLFEFCNALYIGRAYCPWMKGKRKVENFQCAQHIAIDLDTGDERSSVEKLRLHPLVQGYGAIIHETPSHTDYAPRARVIFPLDELITTPEGYKAAIQVVTDLFDGADPACVDAARFFYGNGKLSFYQHAAGLWMTPDACLPVSEVRRMARLRLQQQRLANPQRTMTPIPHSQPRPQIMPLCDMADKLDALNPYSLDYAGWAKVVAALGHVYGFEAYGVARQWSDTPGKTPLSEKKWRSLIKEHPKAAGYGTLLWALKEYA